ncbi:MAG: alginate lyase family protein [Pseudomonadota bacterium]
MRRQIVFLLAALGSAHALAAPALWCDVQPQAGAAASAVLARAQRQLGATPHPLATMHTEGTLPHQGIRDASLEAQRDFPVLRDAALAWRLGGAARYLRQADTFLLAWATTYVPSFNPIDETKLDALIESYAWTRDDLAAETRAAVARLLRKLAEGYIARAAAHSDPNKPPHAGTWTNNWQSHRIKIMAMAAAALQDADLLRQVEPVFLRQLGDNMKPDGSVIDFAERDALHYVVYDLEPLTMAALAARPFGYRWLAAKGANGASLAAAIDWLKPYANGERTHEEYVHTHVAFDRQRAQAGVAGFGGMWEPASAASLYWLAAQLDATYQPLARKLAPAAPDWLALCPAP